MVIFDKEICDGFISKWLKIPTTKLLHGGTQKTPKYFGSYLQQILTDFD